MDQKTSPTLEEWTEYVRLLKWCKNHRDHGGTGYPKNMTTDQRALLQRATDEQWIRRPPQAGQNG